jgi:hypothetical protein
VVALQLPVSGGATPPRSPAASALPKWWHVSFPSSCRHLAPVASGGRGSTSPVNHAAFAERDPTQTRRPAGSSMLELPPPLLELPYGR